MGRLVRLLGLAVLMGSPLRSSEMPHCARRAAERFPGLKCDSSTPRGHKRMGLKFCDSSIALVEGDGQRVRMVLHISTETSAATELH
jgi:hypothetical protein